MHMLRVYILYVLHDVKVSRIYIFCRLSKAFRVYRVCRVWRVHRV